MNTNYKFQWHYEEILNNLFKLIIWKIRIRKQKTYPSKATGIKDGQLKVCDNMKNQIASQSWAGHDQRPKNKKRQNRPRIAIPNTFMEK